MADAIGAEVFTTEELKKIDDWLQSGVIPEEVGAGVGLTYSQFRNKLSKTGRSIRVYRRLEINAPADAPRELTTA